MNPTNERVERKRFGDGLMMKADLAQIQVARMSEIIATRLALVAGDVDGEDSAGRQRFKLMSPETIATRACDIAQALMGEWVKRDWHVEVKDAKDDLK